MRFLVFLILVISFNNSYGDDLTALREELKTLRSEVKQIKSVHNEALTHYIKNEVDRALKDRNNSLIRLSSNVENLKIKGDLRWRFQRDEFDKDSSSDSRDRYRIRLRLGFLWETNEGWQLGAGIATGDVNNPYNGRGTNSDVNAGGPWSHADIILDYAYAKHKWAHSASDSYITIGQMINPFYRSPTMWDSDLRPTGFLYEWENPLSKNLDYFLKAAAFSVVHNDKGRDNNDTMLYSVQTGLKDKVYTLALGYHYYTGELYESLSGNDSNAEITMDYQLIDLYTDLIFHAFDYRWKALGHVIHNVKAKDTDSHFADIESREGTSFILGLGVDFTKKWNFTYQFRHMEAHGQPSNLVEGTFGSNQQGHVGIASYKWTKNMLLKAIYFQSKEIAESSDSPDRHDSFMLEVNYKF
jgi:hypothetical protein